MRGSIGLLCGLALLLTAEGVAGQVVRGRVLDAEQARPLDLAFVILLDDAGARAASALTDASGTFRLRAPRSGTYRVRVERIGYGDVQSELLDLRDGEVVDLSLAASPRAIEIEGLSVQGERRCTVRPGEGELTARLWEEARKALSLATWAQDGQVLRFRTVRWRRVLDPESLRIQSEQRTPRSGFHGGSPFVGRPAGELQREGWYRELPSGEFEYYAPDPSVLLSDPFLDAHCFRVRVDDPPTDGWVGLAFEPVERGRVPDIEGVLWIDRETSELRRIEYRYTRLPAGLRADPVGGSLELDRIPEGPWIVRRWAIRTPTVGLRQRRAVDGSYLPPEPYLAGLGETGGEVVAIQTPDGSPLARAAGAVVTGTVFDSVAAAPLAGATVRLSGTGFLAVTDEAGRFRLDAPEGAWSLTFEHDRIDELGWIPADVAIDLAPGDTLADVALAIPPAERIFQGCEPALDDDRGTAVMVGRAPEGVEVVVEWETGRVRAGNVERGMYTARAVPGTGGHFRLCGLPHDEELVIRTERDGRPLGEEIRTSLARGEIRRVELRLSGTEGAPGEAAQGDGAAVQAFVLVRDLETDQLVPDVAVRLDDGPWQPTGAHGRVDLGPVPAGRHRLELRHVAFGEWSDTIDVRPPGPRHWVIEMTPGVIEVEGIDVTVDAVSLAEQSLRMVGVDPESLGRRWISPEDIAAIAVKRDVGSILEWHGINGIRVIRPENLAPGSENMGLCVALLRGRAALEVPGGAGGRGRCALIVVDGRPKLPIIALELNPEDIAAAAVLQPYEATVLFGRMGEPGAVLFWTKQGGR